MNTLTKWVSLAQHLNPNAPAHTVMREANSLFKANEPSNWNTPFAEVDINFSEFVSFVKTTGSQRELDLVYISNFFHKAYTTLHISLAVLNEQISNSSKEELCNVYTSLLRLNKDYLLTNHLDTKWILWLKNEVTLINKLTTE